MRELLVRQVLLVIVAVDLICELLRALRLVGRADAKQLLQARIVKVSEARRSADHLVLKRALGLLQGSGNAIDPTTAGLLGMAKAFAAAGAPSNVPRSGLSALSAGLTGFAEPYAAAKQAGSDSAMKGLMML